MSFIRRNNVEELAMRLKVSHSMAVKSLKFASDFTDISNGKCAIKEFTGEVFRALSVKSLDAKDLEYTRNRLFIVSSLYGILKPFDIIRPYRLDFTNDCGPSGEKLCEFWKKKNTIALVNFIKESSQKEILNLLPGDSMKCFDFKLIKHFATVMKPNFKVFSEDAALKTPNTGRLKELRGLLLRHIITHGIDSLKEILHMSDLNFGADPAVSTIDYPLFICDES